MSKFFELQKKFENNGWQVSKIELPSDAWWALEIWEITSLWRPVDLKAYLSLILDPQLVGGSRINVENDVWDFRLYETMPQTRICGMGIYGAKNSSGTITKLSEMITEVVVLAAQMRSSMLEENK